MAVLDDLCESRLEEDAADIISDSFSEEEEEELSLGGGEGVGGGLFSRNCNACFLDRNRCLPSALLM